jgi:phage shock protein PspC (stress-responsive transcriptional regulator)
MTTTPPEAPAGPGPHEGPRTTRDEVRDLGRLRRSTTDRKIAGVAGGLGRHLDVDPLLLRVALVVLVFFGGAGLLIYGACWLLVPEDDGSEPAIALDERTRTVALVIVGVVAAAALVGDSWGFIGFPWQVAVIGAIVLWALTRNKRSDAPPPYAAAPPSTPSSPAPPAAPAAPTAPYGVNYNVPGHAAPVYAPPVYVPRPRNPRRRGPILFWFTLALIALAEGVLGIADLAGAPVADPAYPALALGVIATMLVLGAFWGRAGGLIALGLVAAVATAGATASDRWETGATTERPQVAADLDASYRYGVGELVIDLTDVSDLAALDGRTLELDVSAGSIDVIVPDGLAVEVDAASHGPGSIRLFGESDDGIDFTASETYDPSGGTYPRLTIDAEINLGEIEMRAS